jgi:hypothetical protein
LDDGPHSSALTIEGEVELDVLVHVLAAVVLLCPVIHSCVVMSLVVSLTMNALPVAWQVAVVELTTMGIR